MKLQFKPALIIGIFAIAFFPSLVTGAADAAPDTVDFRFSPPEWQSAICLPDDPYKSLVDKSGELLYHYTNERSSLFRNKDRSDFDTRVSVEVVSNAVWQKQELFSPRVPIVQTYRAADGWQIVEDAFAVTSLAGASRNDLILVHVTNTGAVSRTFSPRLIVETKFDCDFAGRRLTINGHETISASLKMTGFTNEGFADNKKQRRVIQLESLTVAPGKTAEFFALYSDGESIVCSPSTLEQAAAARKQAIRFWEKAPLPYGRIEVPDAGIQALVDSSIRNIWQAREIKNGLPAFQVGPTCYRSLWICDGAFLLETVAMLGEGDEARNGVAYELTYQNQDGRIDVMERLLHYKGFWKENGLVLWTCVRHAQLTQDKAWLNSVWPKLERIAEYIRTLRRQTMTDESSLDYGLMPPGMPDGGIGGVHYEYTNPYWNLAGLRAFIEGARWLGKTDEAASWQKEYDDFMTSFRKAAARDMRPDSHGNLYLPILMDDTNAQASPQSGQWAFCNALYPGQILAADDPLVTGNLAMLEATEHEGTVCGTGWMYNGIWTYFASLYGHAWLWEGNGRKAAQTLYAFANHAAPVLDWREEQSLRGEKDRSGGDMPHNWASAEFIRLTAHLIELDRGNELHLFEGLPPQWTGPGMETRLDGLATPFGPLFLSLKVDRQGRTATCKFKPLANNCTAVIVHLPDGTVRKLPAQKAGELTFELKTGGD